MLTERGGRSGWALWLLLVVFAFWDGEARGGRAGGGREGAGVRGNGRAHAAAGGSQAMPPALRAAYLAARQAEGGAGYAVREEAGGLVADNPAQGFRVAFSTEGIALAGAGAPRATLRPVRFGCAGEMQEVGRARPEMREGRVAFPREGFVEWYVNGPLGLEQGFSVEEAPRCAGAQAQALEVELGLGEGLSASLEAGGEQLALRDGAGPRIADKGVKTRRKREEEKKSGSPGSAGALEASGAAGAAGAAGTRAAPDATSEGSDRS